MAEELFPGQVGLALLANSMATGTGLFVLINCLSDLSGAHLNPVVSFIEYLSKRLKTKELIIYVTAQMMGAYFGIILTHTMFNRTVFEISVIERSGTHLLISELIATFGLICVVLLASKKNIQLIPQSVAAYITSAYWFTSSTSFANPAVTFARTFTNSFGGMSPAHYLPFLIFQFCGGLLAWYVMKLLNQKAK